jgi:diguanylate cyclase (GGDEF)-like protein
MIKQLRPGDCLARLGGDEFAVVLPDVHSREAVEEIARRLEACYDEPYEGEGRLVRGSASIGIAMYPDDAATGDGLLSAADAAMYFDKQTRSRRGSGSGGQRDKEMSSENLM